MSDHGASGPPAADDAEPGTLTSLIEEVLRAGPSTDRGDGLSAGQVLGRYELRRELGRGGSGVVWEGRDRELGRPVALKVLRVRGEVVREKRLLAEAEVAARLSHPNIVTILDVGRSEQGVYLVQEFLAGHTLATRLLTGPLPLREALRVAIEVCKGLAHAHVHGVVHRDLSPRNVQLCDDGQVKLLDLGMAAAFGRRKVDGGTPEYMAPEQASSAPEDERTDIFALGVLLSRMLTGASRSGGGGSQAGASAGLAVPEVPALGELVEAMLSRDPTNRPRDAAAVLHELQEVEAALPRGGLDVPSRARRRPAPRRRWVAFGAMGATLVCAGLAAGVAAWRGPGLPAARPLVLAASASTTLCSWRQLAWHQLREAPPRAVARNGKLNGQGVDLIDGQSAWLQRSDWNQLFVPIDGPPGEAFAVEAEFLAPPEEGWARGVSLSVFTDPAGPDASDLAHGRGILLRQDPGRHPVFEWGVLDGVSSRSISYSGALPASMTGSWHKLRIEGSGTRCWQRVLLDERPILTATGHCDLGGHHVMLGSQGGHFTPEDVAWRNLRIFEGSSSCQ